MKKFLAIAVVALCLSPAFSAPQKVDPEQHYLLLAAKKTSTIQKELDEASGQGFRVVTGSPTSGTEMAVFLERASTPPDTYKYKLLATSRTSTMQKELNEAAGQGYRLLPRTMIAKRDISLFRSDDFEIVVLLEREPNSTKKYHYKLLATTLTGTLQKEVTEALKGGYVIAGMVSRGEHMVIMEKESKQ